MTPIVIAAAIAGVLAIVLLIGVARVLKSREITMVDYPELPPPEGPDDEANKRTAQAG
jgi:hypothetical protein